MVREIVAFVQRGVIILVIISVSIVRHGARTLARSGAPRQGGRPFSDRCGERRRP
ncbi:MAG: hypothetical protein HYV09_17475 [Deltaproteobacteria bacterium]|nr:hypothetical protein [Deltaproteobacteria bacterium]